MNISQESSMKKKKNFKSVIGDNPLCSQAQLYPVLVVHSSLRINEIFRAVAQNKFSFSEDGKCSGRRKSSKRSSEFPHLVKKVKLRVKLILWDENYFSAQGNTHLLEWWSKALVSSDKIKFSRSRLILKDYHKFTILLYFYVYCYKHWFFCSLNFFYSLGVIPNVYIICVLVQFPPFFNLIKANKF